MANLKNLRIIYAGTPEFALPPLDALLAAGTSPVAVLTQPDRPAGRGRQLQASPVKSRALEAGIPVLQPQTLKDPGILEHLTALKPDLMIVVAYGLILPVNVLELPSLGCWNIHASLLPRWRGAAPIQRAIEAGDTRSGVCIMQMEEGLDTGPVLKRQSCALDPNETGGSLHDTLAEMGAQALVHCLRQLADGSLPEAEVQSTEGVTYARKLMKAEAEIQWDQHAVSIERRIRAFNPWPVAWCMLAGERIRIWAARHRVQASRHAPGEVIAAGREGIDIACGEEVIRITELQRPGGRRITAENYLNARPLPIKPAP